jgi:16S rRNA (cytosine967-C5)-methyltransferase
VERLFKEAEIKYEISPIHDESVMITSLRDIRSLPVFTEGLVTVQDASATLAINLADPKPGMTVYDLCAAPGGKAVHAGELMKNQGRIVALELYESKLKFITENGHRSGVDIIEPIHGDAREFQPDEKADVVLVDAPCTGLGTLSKKPDIKWRRTLDDVRRMAGRQLEILEHAAELVKSGGVVVYSTCTIEPEENVDVVNTFLADHPDFSLEPAEQFLPEKVCKDGFLQTFPHEHHSDGAFAARLRKQ